MRLKWIAGLVVMGAVTTANVARAEPEWIIGHPSDERRATDLSFGPMLDGHQGFGLTPGFTFGIPLLDSGFIRPINDSVFLEPGVFMAVRWTDDDTYLWVIPEFGPRWNFHLTPRWDAFATLKLGWAIGNESDLWLRGTAGMNWWFARPWALRLETTQGHHFGPGIYAAITYQFL